MIELRRERKTIPMGTWSSALRNYLNVSEHAATAQQLRKLMVLGMVRPLMTRSQKLQLHLEVVTKRSLVLLFSVVNVQEVKTVLSNM